MRLAETPERNASQTALGAAYQRAVHQLLDDPPPILDDPIILQLLDPASLEYAQAHPGLAREPGALALRAHIVLRSRYAEDCLAEAVRAGMRQYIVLGAGYDTFAYRQPEWAHPLTIFEVDHPASQRAKRDRLAEKGIAEPSNLRYVPVDLETTSLRVGLAQGGVNLDLPVLVAWLGVMMYLTPDAVAATFREFAALAPRSEMVLTYTSPDSGRTSPASMQLAARVAAIGEPLQTRVTPEELRAQLEALGLQVSFPSLDEVKQTYFRDRRDGLDRFRRVSIAKVLLL